jgi:hypothetical protein
VSGQTRRVNTLFTMGGGKSIMHIVWLRDGKRFSKDIDVGSNDSLSRPFVACDAK